MEIDSRLLKRVLHSASPASGKSRPPGHPALQSPVIGRASIVPITRRLEPEQVTVVVRELRPAGICIGLPYTLHATERFLLLMAARSGRGAILCEVKHWRAVSGELFAIRANFVRLIESLPVAEMAAGNPMGVSAAPIGPGGELTTGNSRRKVGPGLEPAELHHLREVDLKLAELLDSPR